MDIYDLLDRFFRSTLNSDFLNTASARRAASVFESAERDGLTAENITEILNSDSDLSLSRFANAAAPVTDRITDKLAHEPREVISALMISPQSEAINSKEYVNVQMPETARGYDLPTSEFYRESIAVVNPTNQTAASFQAVSHEDTAAVLDQRERYGSYTQSFASDNKLPDTADRVLTLEREILRSASEPPQVQLASKGILNRLDQHSESVRAYTLTEGVIPVSAAKIGLEGGALGGDILEKAQFQLSAAPSSVNIPDFVLTEAGQQLKNSQSMSDLGKTVLSSPSDLGKTVLSSPSDPGETIYPPSPSELGKSVYLPYAGSHALSGTPGGEWEKNTAPTALPASDQNVFLNHVPNVISKAEESGYIKAENGIIKETATSPAKNGGLLQMPIPNQTGAELFYTQPDPLGLGLSYDTLVGVKEETFKTAAAAEALNAVGSLEAVSAHEAISMREAMSAREAISAPEAELMPFASSVQADALTSATLPTLSQASPKDISQKEISEIRAASAGNGSTACSAPEININVSGMCNTAVNETDINEVISSITDAVIEASRVVSERAGE